MNVLTLEDLLEVSMFKCKICCRRLQCPVLQVGMFGNICGVCNERSVFTDVIPNADVETLLAKLLVPCNYKERGCTYDGSYYNTCKHERDCEFRDKICPLAYLGLCDNVPGDFHVISTHISSCHEDNVLLGKANCCVDVPNPTETDPDLFYLLNMNSKMFLLRTWIDFKEECVFYIFYYSKNDIDLKNVKIAFNIKLKNTVFNITGGNDHVHRETSMGSGYETDKAFRVPTAILKSLNCLESVEITINIDEKPEEPIIEVKNDKSPWIRCANCEYFRDTINICRICDTLVCNKCAEEKKWRDCRHDWISFDSVKREFLYETKCQNAECNQILTPKEKIRHNLVCSDKKQACPLQVEAQCDWHGLITNLAFHVIDAHPKLINRNTCTVATTKVLLFVKSRNVFKQTFNLSSNGDLSVTTSKLTGWAWNKSWKWEIRVKGKDSPMMMVITDLCTSQGYKKTINVKNYVNQGGLILYADVNCMDESVS